MGISLTRFLRKVKYRIAGAELPGFKPYRHLFEGKKGLEIGGPSKIFQPKEYLPVYKYAAAVDGVNFSNATVWEGAISEGNTYQYTPGKTGHQYIREGNELSVVPDATYDFLVSSHNLEHFANPMQALAEWNRVLKPGGALLLILPHPQYTFDHKRPLTKFEHVLADYQCHMGEDDLTHLEEVVSLHDIARDPGIGSLALLKERSLKNIENRCIHHHVFSDALLDQMLRYFDFTPLYHDFAPPFNLIAMGQKKA